MNFSEDYLRFDRLVAAFIDESEKVDKHNRAQIRIVREMLTFPADVRQRSLEEGMKADRAQREIEANIPSSSTDPPRRRKTHLRTVENMEVLKSFFRIALALAIDPEPAQPVNTSTNETAPTKHTSVKNSPPTPAERPSSVQSLYDQSALENLLRTSLSLLRDTARPRKETPKTTTTERPPPPPPPPLKRDSDSTETPAARPVSVQPLDDNSVLQTLLRSSLSLDSGSDVSPPENPENEQDTTAGPSKSQDPAFICSKERPYGCEICHRHFKRRHHLKEHSRIHTGEAPFVCRCGLRFSRSSNIAGHRKRCRAPISRPAPE